MRGEEQEVDGGGRKGALPEFFFRRRDWPWRQFCLGGGGTQLCLLGSEFSTFWTRKVWYFFFSSPFYFNKKFILGYLYL